MFETLYSRLRLTDCEANDLVPSNAKVKEAWSYASVSCTGTPDNCPEGLRKIKNLSQVNPLNAELNPICCLLALLGAQHFLHVTRIRVKSLTLRLLMSYIYIYVYIYMHSFIHSFISIQPLGRFSRNQNPFRRPVWLWHTAFWASS